MSQSVPLEFQALLPSAPIENLDSSQDKTYIIESLLKKSTWAGWQWMLSRYAQVDIAEVVQTSRLLTPKDVMIWTYFYNLNPKDVACLQTKSPQTPASSWAY